MSSPSLSVPPKELVSVRSPGSTGKEALLFQPAPGRKPSMLMRGLWSYRGIWLLPLACECLLLLTAVRMSWAFADTIMGASGRGGRWDWPLIAACMALYLAGKGYSELRELFMPRAIAFVGVGVLILISLGTAVVIMTLRPGELHSLNWLRRVTVALPLIVYVWREYSLLKGARYSPRFETLEHRRKDDIQGLVDRFNRQLKFWLN